MLGGIVPPRGRHGGVSQDDSRADERGKGGVDEGGGKEEEEGRGRGKEGGEDEQELAVRAEAVQGLIDGGDEESVNGQDVEWYQGRGWATTVNSDKAWRIRRR